MVLGKGISKFSRKVIGCEPEGIIQIETKEKKYKATIKVKKKINLNLIIRNVQECLAVSEKETHSKKKNKRQVKNIYLKEEYNFGTRI